MSLRTLPKLAIERPAFSFQFDPAPNVVARWNAGLRMAAEDDAENVVSIMGVIGEDWWTGQGITARKVQQQLAEIGARNPVTIHMNSPGGDYFEGLAIYNTLRDHKAKVTVRIFGMAASAASLIAMAGDQVEIPKSAFMMIHNTWAIVMGDRHTLRDAAELFEKFDGVAVSLYAERTGIEPKKIGSMMDDETFMSGEEAVDQGFADALMDRAKITEGGDAKPSSLRKVEQALQRAGLTRAERRNLLSNLFADKPGAGGDDTDKPGAVHVPDEVLSSIRGLADDVRGADLSIKLKG